MPPHWFKARPSNSSPDIWEYPHFIAASYEGVFPHEVDVTTALLEQYIGRGLRVLELGVGWGRIALPLAGRGFQMTGLDRHPTMLKEFNRRMVAAGVDVPIIQADMRDFETSEPFDALLCPLGILNLIWSRKSLLAHMRCAVRALAPGGVYIAVVCAATSAKRILPHRASFETQHAGIRTATQFILTRRWTGRIASEHHLYVEHEGKFHHLLLAGSFHVWTPDTIQTIQAAIPEFRFDGWYPIFDATSRRSMPVDSEAVAVVVFRRVHGAGDTAASSADSNT